ncbi:MAG: sulfotransferase [bacterium]
MDMGKIRLPNFLLVGAAKSGTTSLYHYLNDHPQIYMSPVKEPKFISGQFCQFPFQGKGDNLIEEGIVKTFDVYENLFREVDGEKAIGEASADNLYYYEHSIKYIKKYLGEVKIIVALRNPVDRAFSSYTHLRRDMREDLTFEQAIQAEKQRKKQNWEFIWFYIDVGFYYKQVRAFIDNFNEVKICLYDDLSKRPKELLTEIYEFLDVDKNFAPRIYIKHNVSGVPKSGFLQRIMNKQNLLKSITKNSIKPFLSEKRQKNLLEKFKALNLKKPQLNPKTRDYLRNFYREDIRKLQDLIHRDLSHWLGP